MAAVSVYANVWDPVLLKGRTDKTNPVDYKCGEPIVFTLYSENIAADAIPEGTQIKWMRNGDDGKYEEGFAPFKAGAMLCVTTKMDIAGFIRLEATVKDAMATGPANTTMMPASGMPRNPSSTASVMKMAGLTTSRSARQIRILRR